MADRDADASEAPLVDRQAATLDRQEAVIDEQATVIADLRERNDRLRRRLAASNGVAVDRRSVLQAGGALAALGLGVGTASAQSDPTGQVGTGSRPIETLYADGLAGPLTGGNELTSMAGTGLAIEDGDLVVSDSGGPSSYAPTLSGLLTNMDGTGTAGDPYVITTDHELQAMNADLDAHYELGDDVDASLTDQWNDGDGFDPVGGVDAPFQGTLEGNDHEIAGLVIDRTDSWYVGLFGYVGSNSSITGVRLADVDVQGENTIGSLAGRNEGEVTDSTATGSVAGDTLLGGLLGDNLENGTVSNASVDVTVESPGDYAGGLVGSNVGTITDCHATGSVTAEQDRAGGLAGNNYEEGEIRNSYATGTVSGTTRVGGLVGINEIGCTVANSYALGDASADTDQAGGLVGDNAGTVTRCFSTGAASAQSDVGGLIGNADGTTEKSYWDVPASGLNSSPAGTGIGSDGDTAPAAGMVGDDLDGDLDSAFDFSDVWETVDAENDSDATEDGYPVLQALDRATQLEVRG